MKYIEHSTSELICEDLAERSLSLGDQIILTESGFPGNPVRVQVRELGYRFGGGPEVRVDIVDGDLLGVDDEDKVTTVGVLPRGFYVTRDDDGDWVLVPPAHKTIFSTPGEPVVLSEPAVLSGDAKRDAVEAARQYLVQIGEIK